MIQEWPFKDEEVANFLQHNPQFFEEYADLVANIFVAHPHGGEVISLAQKQIFTLREKNQKLENTLQRWMHYGKENDQLNKKMHELTLALISARNQSAVLSTIKDTVPTLFQVSHLALRLWWPFHATPAVDAHAYFAEHPVPHCSETLPYEIRQWLEDDSHILQSFAVIPLQREKLFGVLLLGSVDKNRFSAEHDTLYLSRLSTLLTEAILAKSCSL